MLFAPAWIRKPMIVRKVNRWAILSSGAEKGIAPRKLGKGGGDVETDPKPFSETLSVIKPAREGLTSSRKRVLRCGGVTRTAKRRQRVSRPGYGASKVDSVSLCRSPHRGHAARAARVRSEPSHRSRRTRHRHNGGFPGTWEMLLFPPDPVGSRGSRI